jgi:hypothetical protein
VHEDVHKRARQQQQERRCGEEMGSVLSNEKVGGDSTDDEQADGITGAPEGLRADVVLGMAVVHSSPLMSIVLIEARTSVGQSVAFFDIDGAARIGYGFESARIGNVARGVHHSGAAHGAR